MATHQGLGLLCETRREGWNRSPISGIAEGNRDDLLSFADVIELDEGRLD